MKLFFKNMIPFWLGQKLRGGLQKIKGFIYRGNSVYCPFCNRTFRKFLPGGIDLPVNYEKQIVGAGLRKNNVCPRCYSLDRDRLIYLYLKNKTTIFTEPHKVFHVAPEGCLRSLLANLTNIVYLAGVKYLEGYYYSRLTNLVDITNLPYEEGIFDTIICNHVLEHIVDDAKALSELHRVLKPGGWAILQVPISKILETTYEDHSVTSPEERERHFGQFDHVRIYGQDYTERIKKAGFRVQVHNAFKEQWVPDPDRYGLNPDENIYIAIK
jgi:SAM-dependent methyltransferase